MINRSRRRESGNQERGLDSDGMGHGDWSEGEDSSMILRAWYWGTRLCHCMECMVKNARQGIDQSRASRSNIHMTILWSVNKPRVPFRYLPRVYFTHYPPCFVPGKLPAFSASIQFPVPQKFPTLPPTPKEV